MSLETEVSALSAAVATLTSLVGTMNTSTQSAYATAVATSATNAGTAGTSAATATAQASAASASAAAADAAADAALIGANAYASTAAAIADAGLSAGSYFRVVGSGDIAATEYKKVASANLFDVAAIQLNKYVSSTTGLVTTSTGWGCSAYIPVTAGQTYILSGTRSRVGLSFFTSNTGGLVSGSYNSGATPLTVTAPVGATHVVFNLYTNVLTTYSQIQFEPGTVANPYAVYGGSYAVLQNSYPSAAAVASVADVIVYIDGKNMYNPAVKQAGEYLNASGGISLNAAWGCTGYMPVTAGQSYTISSNTTKRAGAAFFTNDSNTSYISGSYSSSSSNPLTVTAPVGATHMIVNLYSNTITEPTQVQIEPGTAATAYEAYFADRPQVDKDSIYPAIQDTVAVYPHDYAAVLSLSSSPALGSSYIECTSPNGGIIRQKFSPFVAATLDDSPVFNFHSELLNGVVQVTAGDDAAPYRVFGTTIGANHGYAKTACTVATHTKTAVDVGSVWSDGTNQWVLVAVPNSTTLTITRRNANVDFTGTGSPLTHVSGATNTASFTPTAVAQSDWYPVIKNRTLTISVDGVVVTDFDADYPYNRNVTFAESYEIMNKNSIADWLITQVGTSPAVSSYSGTSDLSVSIAYVFDTDGGCTINTDFLALNAVADFQDIMFTQAGPLTAGVNGAVRYYVPKSLPFTHESVSYDFTGLRDMTGLSIVSRIDFTPARCEATGLLVDRVIQMNNGFAMAIGYLPVQSASAANRRTLAARKALQISQAAKIYPSAIDSASITSLAAGAYYSVKAYRKFYNRVAGITASYVVRAVDADYLYCDWHTSADAYRLKLPQYLHGRAFEVVEQSSNVTVLSGAATSSIAFKILNTLSYGFAVLKFL